MFAPCSPISFLLLELYDCSYVVVWFIRGGEVGWGDVAGYGCGTPRLKSLLDNIG